LRRVGGQLLGFGGQRLLAGGLGGPMFLAPGALRGDRRVGMFGDAGQPGRQRIDVAEHGRRRQRFGQLGRVRLDLSRVSASGGQALLHEGDLGGQVIEAPAEVGERRLPIAGLPGADDAFAGGADQPYRAVVVHAPELVRIAGGRHHQRVSGAGSRCRPRAGTRSRTRHWPS
jgi:hypothetical protein